MSLVKNDSLETINQTTKEAWVENWRSIEIEKILEIFNYPRVKKIMDIIMPYLFKEGICLEAGCGLGPYLIKISSLGYNMVGIDYQVECLRKIKEFQDKQKVLTADVRRTPFQDNIFNTYLSFGVIEHFPEGPVEALKEAYRVLRPNGKLLVFVPYYNILKRLKAPWEFLKSNKLLRGLFGKKEKMIYYQRYFKAKELEDEMKKANFVIDKTIPVDHIFSLVEFSSIFRDRHTYDGENKLAVYLGNFLEKFFPWMSAGSLLFVCHKS
ncbi:MAG: class I SAM-dependent methyltransferase [Candidatus Omnitrophica bacterium]|nr:class I SAM-dependent methyltransferase [Candidatus Omnitrophota bacterium]